MATKTQGRGAAKLERLKYIRELMAACMWVAGVTVHEVAAKFGVSVKAIEQDAAEASRQLKLAIGNDEELRTEIKINLQFIRRKAILLRTPKGMEIAVDALRVMSGIVEKPKELNLNAGAHTLKEIADLQKSTKANKS